MSQKSAYPFCFTRCRAIDLNHWLFGGLYPCHFLHRLVMKKNKGGISMVEVV
ncbi:DNA gyrase inhibitor YacG [Bartonella krasnovii]|uniref:DNA gyrase inhibitor YacG n=1 Tax=Bartonella krasnovii TaxID=2267275 RepID=UPI003B983D54